MERLTEAPPTVDYSRVIPWARLQEHLRAKIREKMSELRESSTMDILNQCKGSLDTLERLLNLPNTLSMLDTKDEAE